MNNASDLLPLFGNGPADPSQQIRYRQGIVVAWDPITANNVVNVGGRELVDLPILNTSEALLLEAGSVVAVVVIGQDGGARTFAILGRMTLPGTPQAGSALSAIGAESDSVNTSQSTTSTTYTDLATTGPTVTINVGASGRLLVIVGAEIQAANVTGGAVSSGAGWMGYDGTGANTFSPSDDRAVQAWIRYNASPNSTQAQDIRVAASRVSLLVGLTPGATTLTARYKSLSTGATFDGRNLTAIAL